MVRRVSEKSCGRTNPSQKAGSVTVPNLTESVKEMLKIARGYPGCVQRHNSKDGLRVHLKVEDGWVFFNILRLDEYPTQDEYLLALQGVLADSELASLQVLVGDRRCIICVWLDDYD